MEGQGGGLEGDHLVASARGSKRSRDLPEDARRYPNFTVEKGTTTGNTARITTDGALSS